MTAVGTRGDGAKERLPDEAVIVYAYEALSMPFLPSGAYAGDCCARQGWLDEYPCCLHVDQKIGDPRRHEELTGDELVTCVDETNDAEDDTCVDETASSNKDAGDGARLNDQSWDTG